MVAARSVRGLIESVVLVYLTIGSGPLHSTVYADGLQRVETGITGTAEHDTINSTQPLDVNATLSTTSEVSVTTEATGIDGLSGDDLVTNLANIATNASSTMDNASVLIGAGGTNGHASSYGMRGAEGSDTLTNKASIFSTSTSLTTILQVIMQMDLGVTSWPTTATAEALGLEGGNGLDELVNNDSLYINATADTNVGEVHISAVDIPVDSAVFDDGRIAATSIALGLVGDRETGQFTLTPTEREVLTNNGLLSAASHASVDSWQTAVELTGAAQVDDSTLAHAYAAGILGGVNPNFITNTQDIYTEAIADANMTSWDIKMSGFGVSAAAEALGHDVGSFKTVAESIAVGIAGQDQNDVILNQGSGGFGSINVYGQAKANSKVWTLTISPFVGTELKLAAFGATASLALPELLTNQIPENEAPTAYGNTGTVATTDTRGILSGAGDDDIENHVTLTAWADAVAENLSPSISMNLGETSFLPIPETAMADTSTLATASSAGLDGSSGHDMITNTSDVNAVATAKAESLGIGVTLTGNLKGFALGAAAVDGSSAASATAKGIAGGTGGDTISNTDTGTIIASATARGHSASTSVMAAGEELGIAAGVTMADVVTDTNATSYGIDAEDPNEDSTLEVSPSDVVTNMGLIESRATAITDANAIGVSVAASMKGVAVSTALTKANVTAGAQATGIRSGIGQDTIDNTGSEGIITTATADSSSRSISVAISAAYQGVAMGASFADANNVATAAAEGIDSGASHDTITNDAPITASSTATASSQAIAVTASVPIKGFSAGASYVNAETNSESQAIGINAGAGDDTVENTSMVRTSSVASTRVDAVSINASLVGTAIADASSEAKAESTGLTGGAGVDTVTNRGTVVTTAVSDSDDSGSTFNLAGVASGDISSASTATATGLSGGGETTGQTVGDTLTNTSGASITAIADANAYVDNLDINAGGVAFVKAGTEAESHATAIQGGAMGDTIENDGSTSSIANSDVQASSFDFNFAGAQLGSVGTHATGTAIGIDGGNGSNLVTNDPNGQIHTYAHLSTTSLNTEIGVLSAQFVLAGVDTDGSSCGILTGHDDDRILNLGSIDTTANILGEAGGASLGLLTLSLVNGFASANIDGIDAGDGNDVITNEGTIWAGRIREGDDYLVKADTAAVSFDLISLLLVTPGANAHITGIDGGAGNDILTNSGTIFIGNEAANDECTSSRAMVIGKSYGYGGQIAGVELAFAGSSASITALGMSGGAGNDLLTNTAEGQITVKARSYADVDCETFAGLGLTDTIAESSADSDASATGMVGGHGQDILKNYGAITADALTIADANSYAYVALLSNPHGDSEAEATARAAGIDGGSQGSKVLDNVGSINVRADAGARPYAFSNSGTMNTYTDAYGLAQSQAFGITSGNIDNDVNNATTGSISVTARAGTYDTSGHTGYAGCDEVATISAGHYDSSRWTPLSAQAAGIALVDGNDRVVNNGSIIVDANAEGQVYAHTLNRSAVNRNPDSDAKSVILAQAQGITAGAGSNKVTNDGQVTVTATSYAAPKTYSWSQYVSTSTEAYGDSNAVATGLEADGSMTNSLDGVVDVTARAKSYVNADTKTERAQGTALLHATATGFSTFTASPLTELQTITNNGSATVRALADQDNNQACAYIRSSLTSGAAVSDANGIFVADAAGIRVGDGTKKITNNGSLNVLAREEGRLADAIAFSTYNRTITKSYGEGITTATGVWAAAGENHIYNLGTMNVNALINVDTRGYSDSGWQSTYTTYATSETHAEATGQGISTGAGDDEIINSGLMTISSSARANSYARADEYATSITTSEADAVGIDGGAGNNTIANENTGVLNVSATARVATSTSGDYRTWNPETTASAVGMTVGDGGSTITNSGTINVQALDYDNISRHEVPAIGIRGGSGDDTIINDGDIETYWKWVYVIPTVLQEGTGIAIDAGDGNDLVMLGDGSSANGDIRLGSGDDTLWLTGIPSVNGVLDAGAGEDRVVLDGVGSFAQTLSGFNRVTKQGEGLYRVTGLDPVDRLEIQAGVLQINGDYQFAAEGRLAAVTHPDGSYGQLAILGAGALNGTLAVTPESGIYRQSRVYDIITAGTLTGSFKEVQLPDIPLLKFSVEQTPGEVQVAVAPQPFSSVASNRVERKTGDFLDSLLPQASGDMAQTLGIFQGLTSGQFSSAFASLNPSQVDSATTTTYESAHVHNSTLLKRVHSLRKLYVIQMDEPNATGWWYDSYGQWGHQADREGYAGYKSNLYGMTLGLDHLVREDKLLGLSLGYSVANIETYHQQGNTEVKGFFLSLYGSHFTEKHYVDATVSVGLQHYDNRRNLVIGSLHKSAQSDHTGLACSGLIETGLNINRKQWVLQPFTALELTHLYEQGFSETGAGDLNQIVQSRNTLSLTSQLGLRCSRVLKLKDNRLIPEVGLAWNYDFDVDNRSLTTSLAGAPNNRFSIPGRSPARHGLTIDAGLTFFRAKKYSAILKYRGDCRDGYQAHSVLGELRYEF